MSLTGGRCLDEFARRTLRRWLAALPLALTPLLAAQPPEEDPRAALVRMGEAVAAVRSYRAEVHRVTEARVSEEVQTADTVAQFAIGRPNRLLLDSLRPEGHQRVVCDGERLTIWSDASGITLDEEAPGTLALVDERTQGLAAEGLALAGLFLAADPTAEFIEGFDTIHDIDTADLDGRTCRVIGLEQRNGLRMIVWIDTESWLPRQVVLDATPALREMLTEQNVNDRGARVTVTERHDRTEVNPQGLEFVCGAPPRPRAAAASPESEASDDRDSTEREQE